MAVSEPSDPEKKTVELLLNHLVSNYGYWQRNNKMTDQTKTIVESNNFIVLDKYIKESQAIDSYQTEADLEREFIQDLTNQGYDFYPI